MAASSVKFSSTDNPQFFSTLRKRVTGYFKSNEINPHANAAMVSKTIMLLLIYFIPYTLLMSHTITNIWAMWGLCLVMGVGLAGIGMGIQHDANHGSYSGKTWVNTLLGYSMNLIGGNRFNWKIQHNIKHHTFTNVYGADEDLENGNVVRLSPYSEWKPAHKYQATYSWFLYVLSTLSWVVIKDYKWYFGMKEHRPAKSEFVKEMVILFVTKAIYYVYAIILPLIILDVTWWQFLIGFLTMHFTSGFLLSVTFQLAHIVEHADHKDINKNMTIEESWAVHQLNTTANFCRKNKVLCWYLGGLNFQVEHHLFPHICHIHYPEVAKIVKETAEEFEVPYNEYHTLKEAIDSHQSVLKAFSKPDAEANFVSPLKKKKKSEHIAA